MLRWELHTLDGQHLATLGPERDGGEVRDKFNDVTTAKVSVSVYDPAVQHVRPLDRLLKVWYLDHPKPIFTGPLLLPDWQGAAGRVELAAQDASYRLDRAPLLLNPVKRANQPAIPNPRMPPMDYGMGPPTYESLDQLIEAARPVHYFPPEEGLEIPDHGVKAYAGTDVRKPMPVMEIQRGESVWSLIRRLGGSVFGPDFELAPIRQTPGSYDYCELLIWRRRGRELQDDPNLVFHFGHGRNNLRDAGYRPAGDQATNTYYDAFSVSQDGDTERVVNYYDPASLEAYGLLADYESASGCTGSAGKGISKVAAYREPPGFFTFEPAIEGYTYPGLEDETFGVPPRLSIAEGDGGDYGMGDTIRVIAKRGYFRRELVGRVQEIGLTELDAEGNVQADVKIAPRVGAEGISKTFEDA